MAELKLKSFEFRREREAAWRELEGLVARAESGGVRALSPWELMRLPTLYRGALSALSVARSISLDRALLDYLESLSARAYFVVYGARSHFGQSVLDFLRFGFPDMVRRSWGCVLIAALCLTLGGMAGFLLTAGNPDWYFTLMPEGLASGRSPTSTTEELRAALFHGGDSAEEELVLFSSFLFTHNAGIGMFAFALGIALGVPTVVLLLYNGLILGAFAALYAGRDLSMELWGWLLIHGGTELSAVILCGAAGLKIAAAVAFPGEQDRLSNLARTGRGAARIVLGAVVMFFIAGLLEGIGRQLIQDTVIRYAVAIAVLAFWTAYFLAAGRGRTHG